MKKCIRCNKKRSLKDFYVNDSSICKECIKESARNWRIKNGKRARETVQDWRTKNRDVVKEHNRAWSIKNRDRKNEISRLWRRGKVGTAHHATKRKLQNEKPAKCSMCNKKSDLIHGHHPDYDKPLEVIWCCPRCHGKLHRMDKQEVGIN